MSSKETRQILSQLVKKEITLAQATALLGTVGARKLRGVTATKLELDAYREFTNSGDFRAFARELGLDTAAAQNALGRLTRAVHEKQPD